MKLTCAQCRGKQSFIVTNGNKSVVVCGNHMAWAIRSISSIGEQVTVTYVEPQHVPHDPTRRMDSGTPLGEIRPGA